MDRTVHIEGKHLNVMMRRLAIQLAESHDQDTSLAIIGLQPRGIHFAQRIRVFLNEILGEDTFEYGELDSTFYRDDFRRSDKPLLPNSMMLNFDVDGKKVVFIDDVLFTGRSVRSALNAISDFGRPEEIELMVLVDRRYKRELPIEPDYTGVVVDTRSNDRVLVEWDDEQDENNKVWIVREGND
jgi:pyrimidine operon attenuation protein/uracil phosphoribosyltransferase